MGKKMIEVHDLGMAAALVCFGCIVQDTVRDENGRVNFVFIDSRVMADLKKRYLTKRFRVDAREYFDNLKMLKSMIYEDK